MVFTFSTPADWIGWVTLFFEAPLILISFNILFDQDTLPIYPWNRARVGLIYGVMLSINTYYMVKFWQ